MQVRLTPEDRDRISNSKQFLLLWREKNPSEFISTLEEIKRTDPRLLEEKIRNLPEPLRLNVLITIFNLT
jgi:hypothetical protein